jgi:hypothetical protein
MHLYSLSYYWTLIQRAVDRSRRTIDWKTKTIGLSLYRYDSTGRMVHYGPEGDIVECDSAFQIVRSRIAEADKSLSLSVKRVS